jgi:hypothetical protein
MSDILSEVGSIAGSVATGGIGGAVESVATLIGRFVTDKNAQAQLIGAHEHDKAEYALAQLAAQKEQYIADIELLKAQAATNTVEAGSSNLFVSGWRPFCGWAAAVTVFGGIWAGLIMLAFGHDYAGAITIILGIPNFLLLGMLGLHSYERKQGVAPDQSPSGVPTPSPKK